MSAKNSHMKSRSIAVIMLTLTGMMLILITNLVAALDPAGNNLLYKYCIFIGWISFSGIILWLIHLQWGIYRSRRDRN